MTAYDEPEQLPVLAALLFHDLARSREADKWTSADARRARRRR